MAADQVYEAGEHRLTVDHLLHLLHGVNDVGSAELYALIVEKNEEVRTALERALGKVLPLCRVDSCEDLEALFAEVSDIVLEGRGKEGLIVTDFDSADGVGRRAADLQENERPVVVSQVEPLESDFAKIREREMALAEGGKIDGIVSLPLNREDLAVELGVAINRASRSRGDEFDAQFERRCLDALYTGRDEERAGLGVERLLADLGVSRGIDAGMKMVTERVLSDGKMPVLIEASGEMNTKKEVLKIYLEKYQALTKLWISVGEKLSVFPGMEGEVGQFSPQEDSRQMVVGAKRLADIFSAIEASEFIVQGDTKRLRKLIHDLNNILAWMPMSVDELTRCEDMSADERAAVSMVNREMQQLLAETKVIRFANHRLEMMVEHSLLGDHEDLKDLPTWGMVQAGEYPCTEKQKLDIPVGTRVLIIDDDEMVAGFCKRNIERAGGVCELVTSEADFDRLSGDFDWVWLDNNLSLGGGFRTVKMGHELLSRLPSGAKVLVHTGDVESINALAANPYGSLPLVQKRDFNNMSALMMG